MIAEERPLYLHFFDRELGRSLSHTLSSAQAESIVKTLLLGVTSRLYCGLSLLWESDALASATQEAADVRALASLLIQSGELDAVSHHPTKGDFVDSRRSLYAHAVSSYPMYFERTSHTLEISPTVMKGSSTTSALREKMISWTGREPPAKAVTGAEARLLQNHRSILRRQVTEQEEKAITGALFDGVLPDDDREGRQAVLRRISGFYTEHYMDHAMGDICTGVYPYTFYDHLSVDAPEFDVPILHSLMLVGGLSSLVVEPWRQHADVWETIGAWRRSISHRWLRHWILVIVRSFRKLFPRYTPFQLRDLVRRRIESAGSGVRAEMSRGTTEDRLHAAGLRLAGTRAVLARDLALAVLLEQTEDEMRNPVDVLLLTATDLESNTLLDALERRGIVTHTVHGKINSYQDLGMIAGAHVCWGRTEMASGGPGGATLTVSDAIEDLQPNAIVMLGVAFGMDPVSGDRGEQKLGDVLVSTMVSLYEFQSVRTEKTSLDDALGLPGSVKAVYRGQLSDASQMLLQRMRAAKLSWKAASVHFGIMLSGEKVIDNLEYRQALAAAEPKAIGGEMEIAGMFAAANRRPTHWIAAKAICDWADGEKSLDKATRQLNAARNAVNFVLHTLDNGGFASSMIARM